MNYCFSSPSTAPPLSGTTTASFSTSSATSSKMLPVALFCFATLVVIAILSARFRVLRKKLQAQHSPDGMLAPYSVKLKAITFEEKIGEGAFGVVYQGYVKTSLPGSKVERKQRVAIKCLKGQKTVRFANQTFRFPCTVIIFIIQERLLVQSPSLFDISNELLNCHSLLSNLACVCVCVLHPSYRSQGYFYAGSGHLQCALAVHCLAPCMC